MILAKTGNEALAYAMRQINPDVVAAYPITPSTEIVQIFAQYVSDGKVAGINYDYCKGCGICASVCPKKVQAITMETERK